MLNTASRPGTAASNLSPRRPRAGLTTTLLDTHSLLTTTPPNHPPSLRPRQFSVSELFQYYAQRGYVELLHSPHAVEACLGSHRCASQARTDMNNDDDEAAAAVTEMADTMARCELGLGTESTCAPRATALHPIPPTDPRPPRLRPPCSEDVTASVAGQRDEAARRRVLQRRRACQALPGVHTFYDTLYYPGLTVSARSPRTNSPTSVRAFAYQQTTPETDTVGTGAVQESAATQRRRVQTALGVDLIEDFVAAYELTAGSTPSQRRSPRLGAPSTSRRRRAPSQTASGPRRGAPAANLQLFCAALLPCVDAQGMVRVTEVERVMAGVPFEVRHPDAVRALLHLVHVVTEARPQSQLPAPPFTDLTVNPNVAGVAEDTTVTSAHPDTSVSVGSVSPRGVVAAQPHPNTSGGSLKLHTPSSTLPSRRALGNSLSYHPHHRRSSTSGTNPTTTGSRTGSPQAVVRAASVQDAVPVTGLVARDAVAVVLLRELVAAIDALVNGADTRLVVRWVCYEVFAAESGGSGLIGKAVLHALRQPRRGTSVTAGANEITASMVQALSDGFDVLATEEETAYAASLRKGKKRRPITLPPLPAHQNSIIPLHRMRRAHMDFTTFCRLFDSLPQIAAAFAHVWLPLLLTGHVVPCTTPHPSSRSNQTGVAARTTSVTAAKADTSTSRLLAARGVVGPRASKTSFVMAREVVAETTPESVAADLDVVAAQSLSSTSGAIAATLRPPANTPPPTAAVTASCDVTAREPNTYPLSLLGDAMTRRGVLRRVIHTRIEELRAGAEARRRRPTLQQSGMEVSVRDEAVGRGGEGQF